MAKFDRYTDDENRLFIVISQWHKAEKQENGEFIYIPTSVDLLDVYGKKMYEVPVAYFQERIDKGILRFSG